MRIRVLLAACSTALIVAAVGRAGPYPNPLPDFAHPNSPHRTLLSTAGGDLDRPLLVIYVETTDLKFSNTASFMSNRFFAGQFPSVADFFRASSSGKLTFSPAAESDTSGGGAANDGVVEVSLSISQAAFEGKSPADETKLALQEADSSVNFASFDANNDGNLTNSELIVVVSNTRQSNNCGVTDANTAVSLDGKTLGLRPSLVGGGANLVTDIHEVTHAALDATDLYTTVGQLDLMGGVQCADGDDRLWELSSWHKMHFGWIKPTVVTSDGYYSVSQYDTTGASFLLYDPSKNADNYFLVENREPKYDYDAKSYDAGPDSYDQTAGDRGLVIWRVDDAQFKTANANPAWIEVMRPDQSTKTDDGNDAFDPSDVDTPQRTMIRNWRDGSASNVAVRAIGNSGSVMRAYFDVRGPGILVDTYDRLKQGPVPVTLGDPGSIGFDVENTGEASDTFAFTVTVPAGWTASTQTNSLGAAAGTTATIQVTPPLNAAAGLYTLNATGHSLNDPNVTSSSPVQVMVLRRPTTIVYTGDVTADYHDAAQLSAKLTDTLSGTPLIGQTVDFGVGSQSVSATTDGNGVASASLVLDQIPGGVSVSAGFAGDSTYLPSSDAKSFTITREETTTTYVGPTVILQGGSGVTLAAQLLEDGVIAPVPFGQTMTLSLGGQSCTAVVDSTGRAQCSFTFSGALGPQPLMADFAGDAYDLPSSETGKTAIVFAFPSRGAFVLGNTTVATAGPTTGVSWWGAQWSSLNALTGGPAPSAFKGFADTVLSLPTTSPPSSCGVSWISTGGNSGSPPETVPTYMGVLVASAATKSGGTISGSFGRIVVVETDPDYGPSPGHSGTGTIVATFCP
jgi:M6 family metalloprotease-like protein